MNAAISGWLADVVPCLQAARPAALDWLLKVTFLLVGALVLDATLRNRRPVLCGALWNAALVMIVLLIPAELLLPKGSLGEYAGRWWPGERAQAASSSSTFSTVPAAASEPPVVLPMPAAPHVGYLPRLASLPPAAMAPVSKPSAAERAAVTANRTVATARPATMAARLGALWLPLLAGVYLLGISIMLVRLAFDALAARRLRRSGFAADDDAWLDRLARCRERLGLRRFVALRVSPTERLPLVVGCRRPTIMLPADVYVGAEPAMRDAILLHELAHVARADCAWQLFGRLLGCLLWFHPLYWAALRRIEFVRERVCDCVGVHGLGDSQAYVDALLALASRLVGRPSLGLSLAVARSTRLGERLAAIAQYGGGARYRLPWAGRAVLLSAVSVLVALLGHAAFAQAPVPRLPGLPEEAAVALSQYEAETAELALRVQEETRHRRERLLAKLQAIQDEHTRAADLDAAVAVRDQIRALRSLEIAVPTTTATFTPQYTGYTTLTLPGGTLKLVNPTGVPAPGPTPGMPYAPTVTDVAPSPDCLPCQMLPKPPNLMEYHDQIGRTLCFPITGSTHGDVWGTDGYTLDSTLEAAAVHSGAVRDGETAIVCVTIGEAVPTYVGSRRNGVTSQNWSNADGHYKTFTVMRRRPGDLAVESVEIDPGNLSNNRTRLGETFRFRVVGNVDGTLWGTDLYSYDSDLSTAVVHAGLLVPGQEGVVRVTLQRGPKTFTGSQAHGATSADWSNVDGHYSAYRLELESAGVPRVADPSAPASAPAIAPAPYASAVDPGNVSSYRGRVGLQLQWFVTGAKAGGTAWGTDVYTDDSPLGVAAVHAGLLRDGEQGCLLVTILPGLSSYRGSSRNGVTTSDYHAFGGSYLLQRCDAPPVVPSPVGSLSMNVETFPDAFANLRNHPGESFCFEVVGDAGGDHPALWGTNVYTDDSSPAVAAVHSGILAEGERGVIYLTILPGRDAYQGSTAHGVTSRDWNSFGGSFAIRKATPADIQRHVERFGRVFADPVRPQMPPVDESSSLEFRTRQLQRSDANSTADPDAMLGVRSTERIELVDLTVHESRNQTARLAEMREQVDAKLGELLVEEAELSAKFAPDHRRLVEVRAVIAKVRAAADQLHGRAPADR